MLDSCSTACSFGFSTNFKHESCICLSMIDYVCRFISIYYVCISGLCAAPVCWSGLVCVLEADVWRSCVWNSLLWNSRPHYQKQQREYTFPVVFFLSKFGFTTLKWICGHFCRDLQYCHSFLIQRFVYTSILRLQWPLTLRLSGVRLPS